VAGWWRPPSSSLVLELLSSERCRKENGELSISWAGPPRASVSR
jgi:hypothetical protein